MGNKYQEALGHINCYCSNYHTLSNDFDTLQELIDNYSKLSQFDRAVFFNANDVCVNGITYEQLEKELEKYKNLYEQYRFERDIEKDYKELYKKALSNTIDIYITLIIHTSQ